MDGQIYLFKSSGINPIVFDIEAESIGRSLLTELPSVVGNSKKSKGENYFHRISEDTMILDIGAQTTNINIFDKSGFINLSTAIPYAGYYFSSKVADYLGISKEEAEMMIIAKGFQKEDNSLFEVLSLEGGRIIEEAKQAMKYYKNETGRNVKKVIVAGGTSLLPDIDIFFKDNFEGVSVEIGDPLKKIKRKGGLPSDRSILYANAIGLALRGISKDPVKDGINLLPEEIKNNERKIYWQEKKKKLMVIKIVLVAVIIAIALLLFSYYLIFIPLFK